VESQQQTVNIIWPVAPNLLNQKFDAPLPNTVWVSDITYHWTEEGWLYTAIVKDLCTKEVVGHASSKRMTKELVIKALKNGPRTGTTSGWPNIPLR